MTIVGFHASHEQLPPSRLLEAVRRAEQAGFDAAMCSDHFEPWSVRQGDSGYAWSWLAAALEATRFRSASSRHRVSATTRRSPRRRSRPSPRCTPAGSGPRSAAARRSTST